MSVELYGRFARQTELHPRPSLHMGEFGSRDEIHTRMNNTLQRLSR